MLPFQPFPKRRQLIGPEIGEDLAVHIDYRSEILTGKPNHFVISRFIGDDVHFFIGHPVIV
jgi:hypothetical protein